MSVSALAAGNEAEKISRARIEAFINEAHLNTKQTWAQYYENTKDNYPAEIASKIKEFTDLNPKLNLPSIKLKAAQNTNGQQVPVIEIYDNGKTHTLQIIGESGKWAKLDGISLRESDIENPENGLLRLQTANIFFRNEANAYFAKHNVLPNQKLENLKADFSRFKGFPRMTPYLWSSLSMSQRKEFIKQIVAVWKAADAVTAKRNKSGKSRKTSLLENYLKHFLMTDAFADENAGPNYDQTKAKTVKDLEDFLASDPQLLASFKSRVWTPELDRKLVEFEVAAEQKSNDALNVCINTDSGDPQLNNQIACEEFHRALLINERFIAPLRDSACESPSHYIGMYLSGESDAARAEKDNANKQEIHPERDLLCACDDNGSKRVKFHETCEGAQASVAVVPSQPAVPVTPAPVINDEAPNAGSYPAAAPKKSSSSIWPLAIGGAGLGLLIGLLFFNGGKKKSAQASTTNNTVPASCPANKVGTAPNCSCAPCVPPQQIYNFVTCQCTNLPAGIICPNNEAAPNGDVSKCSKCSDGSYKTTQACPASPAPANNTNNSAVPVSQ
jgi:hypothetical protein